MPPGEPGTTLRVVILGTDALLEARPATPIQLARACLEAGFEFVAPVSWGEELLATRIIESVKTMVPPSSLIVHCPFVAEAVREQHDVLPMMWRAAAPPVVAARYVRAAFNPRPLHITYVGRCPGALAPDVDACVLPAVLLGRLLEAGIVPEQQPKYFEEMLPPDRSRYASLPGGLPEPSLLHHEAGARLREAAAATLRAVALAYESSDPVVIDLQTAAGCVCARDRFAATQLEPPRSTVPVVSSDLNVDLAHYQLSRETVALRDEAGLREPTAPESPALRSASKPPDTRKSESATPPARPVRADEGTSRFDGPPTAQGPGPRTDTDFIGTMEPWVPWGLEAPAQDRPPVDADRSPTDPQAARDTSQPRDRKGTVPEDSDDWWADTPAPDSAELLPVARPRPDDT